MKPLCIHRFEAIGSTNDEAMRLLREGAPEGTVVWAERQTAGRGRMGRSWQSAPGNLSMSVIARAAIPAAVAGRIAVSCGLGVARRLRAVTGLPLRTKWPNDLYLYGRKAGGILIETRLGPAGVEGVVVGVGINVSWHPDVSPPGQPASSLNAHGRAFLVEDLVAPVGRAVVLAVRAARHPRWAACAQRRWERTDVAAGPIRVRTAGEEYDAVGVGLDENGALRIQTGGEELLLESGDVSVRAARS
jgi:BirA family biotin operon repressor/biotin-[acetyl-CoA-carboxylase] ligase